MLDFISKLMDKMEPLKDEKNPNVACLIGFLLGGIGLGIYFKSVVDFILLLGILLATVFVFGDAGFVAGAVIAALYGYFRVLNSNERLKKATQRAPGTR
jgi:hypothetical protein